MTQSIRLIAGLRGLMGTKQIEVTECGTVRELLRVIERDYPVLAARILEDGHLNPDVLIVVNGQPMYALKGLATPLLPTDDVMMIPPLLGG